MAQCPECSTYDWSDVITDARLRNEPTPIHHPDCLHAFTENTEKFGQLVEQGLEHLRERLNLAVESTQGFPPVPDYCVLPGAQVSSISMPRSGLVCELSVSGHCPVCQQPYKATNLIDIESQTGTWSCPHCESIMSTKLEDWK